MTFNYTIKTKDFTTYVSMNESITQEEEHRLSMSYFDEKYTYLDEDENIKDIYERIYDQAMATEEFDEAGNPLTDYEVCNFEYPKEIVALINKYKKMKTIYPEA